ncbi:sarcosine oxidase subunit gamma family protein [Mesorhizobium sp. AR07]|uniref:sarcosine oxidase subunit gamma family protein n=1 Tax=Mesorhizobium sp. AR07 TaxID=2865838 RepID=UPI00215F65E2|nr:sarcosine oxidase subunit gamma family protein [Mesorhizobium sp. AR07]UVK43292.1 sarcosine oxidase subunit gamma family protein [Mesorhizobium sp. AR07]
MRDLAEKWSVVPDWQSAVITAPGLVVRVIAGLNQLLVSGDLDAWARTSGMDGKGVGAFGTAQGDRYAARLARDRLLVVSSTPLAIATGWHTVGFAVTTISAGLRVFEVEGAALDAFIVRGTTLDSAQASASAALSFAGISAVVYRHESKLRIHVDRGLATYLWTWMETAVGNIAAGSHN